MSAFVVVTLVTNLVVEVRASTMVGGCAVLIHIQRSLFCLIVTVTEILEVELY